MKKMSGISIFNLILALLVLCMIAGPACAAELSGNDNIGIDVGNDDGTYLVPGTTYQLNLETGTADLHIASDPTGTGDITKVNTTSGTFYITCTNESRVFDDTVLMLAVNGTIGDDFSVAITSSGYRWAGPAENSTLPEFGNLTYASSALSETFVKADLSYGPQIWKPSDSADSPIYNGQNMSDAEDTFSLVFIDLNAGALCNAENLTSIDDLTDRGAVKIEYTFENLESFAVFNAYGLTNTTSAEIVTTNDVSGSLYSVLIEPEPADPILDSITVAPSTASVEINVTTTFTATAYDTGALEMSGITFNWSVSDEAVGNVTSGGVFTGLSAGTVNVTASCGNVSGNAVVTVSEAVVPTPTPEPTQAADAASVVIAPVSADVPVNGNQQFTATAYDSNGDVISGATITWTSSITGVGTIDVEGLFTPVSEGSTVITATADSGVNQTASVTVIAAVEKELTTITLDPDGVIMYTDQIGNLTFTVTGYDQFGDEISAIYTWLSTIPVVGSIDQTGFFTGKTEGTTVVSATSGSVSKTATVEIKEHPDWDVTLIGGITRTLNRTDIIDLASGGLMSYTDNNEIFWEGVNLTSVLALFDDEDPSSFNTTLANLDYNITIKGTKSGEEHSVLITSLELVDNENTFITAYKMDGYEIPEYAVNGRIYWPLKLTGTGILDSGRNVEAITNITIDLPPEVKRIGITPDSESTVAGGDTIQFAATAYDSADVVIENIPFTWSVLDTSIGTIDEEGLFTPLNAGTTDITASYGDVSGTASVTVSTPETYGEVIPAVNNVYLKVANDNGARFDDFGNDTFRVLWTGGGLNAVHISSTPSGYGDVSTSEDLSGTFYVTETGGRGYHDNIFLCVAVKGDVPDNFRLHIQTEGYQWTPNSTPHTEPLTEEIAYNASALDEWFTKDDLIYGPQIWRPAAGMKYPLYANQDMSDTDETYHLMFIDLYGGILSAHSLKVNYEFRNLETMAAFDVYGYGQNADSYNDFSTAWTNRLTGSITEYSGLSVTGHEQSPAASVTIEPSSADVPINGKVTLDATAFDNLGEEILGASFEWASADTGIGTINDNGVFTPAAIGETTVTATCDNVTGSAHITVNSTVLLILESVKVSPPELSLFEDEVSTWQFAAEGFDQFGDTYPDAAFTWMSSDTTVGTIDNETGLFTILAPGQTTITAESGGFSGSASVTIRERPNWELSMSGVLDSLVNRTDFIDIANANPLSFTDNRDNIWAGTSLKTLVGLVDDDDPSAFNTAKAESGYIVTVWGSDESSFAQFESTELVTEGVDYIVANYLNGDEIPDYTVGGRVYWPLYLHSTSSSGDSNGVQQVSSIELSFPVENAKSVSLPAEMKVWSDSTLQLTAEAYDETEALIEDVSFMWSSSNSDVGIVNPNGLFIPLSAGETVVTASISGLSAQTKITVSSSDDEPCVWHVEKDGSGDFTSITEAIAFARNDDTVMVGDGEWSDAISISKHLNLVSRNGPSKTTLTSPPSITGHNTKVSGFTITSGTMYLNPVYDCEISGNIFKSVCLNPRSSVNVTICDNYFNSSSISVRTSFNCEIYNNIMEGGIQLTQASADCKIYDNIIETSGRGLEIQSGSGNQIVNNTISGGEFGVLLLGDALSLMTENTVSGQFYLRSVYAYFPCYLNDFTGSEVRLYNSAPSLGLPFPVTYEYDGEVHTEYIGNYYSTYTGIDADSDGIGDEPKSVDGTVIDKYPLIRPFNNYTVVGDLPVITTIPVSPEALSLNFTETQQFSAVVCDADGAEIPGAIITWSVSDSNLGSINGTGYFTAGIVEDGGTVTVYATSGGVHGTAAVEVLRPTPVLTYITVEPAELETITGSSNQFTATGFDKYDFAIDDLIFTWTSSNPAVGSVDDTGNLTGLSAGTTVITATNGTISESATVNVFDAFLAEDLTLSPEGYTYLNTGGVEQFTVTAYNGAGLVIANPVVTWTSSNPDVGTVNTSGFFTASSAGETTISAQVNDTLVSSIVYIVDDPGTQRTLYVAADGSGDILTISDAVSVANPGDTIIVRKGNYSENIVADKQVTIISESGPEETVITPANAASPIITLTGSESVVKGLTFNGGAPAIAMSGVEGCTIEENVFSGGDCGVNVQNSQNDKICNNSFDSSSSDGVYMRCVASEDVSGNVFTSCYYGIRLYDYGQRSTNVTIQNNYVTGCRYGIYIRGISYQTSCDNVISDNTIIGSTSTSLYLRYINNNLITGNRIQNSSASIVGIRNMKDNTFKLNEISGCTGNFANMGSSGNIWNSDEMNTYLYNGSRYTGYLGNYWGIKYDGTDTNGDGVFDGSYTLVGSNIDYYPLASTLDNYFIYEASSIEISSSAESDTLEVGESLDFTASAIDQLGDDFPEAGIVFTSSNPVIGTVDLTTGHFEALSPGNVTITASCDDAAASMEISVVKMTKKQETTNFEVTNCTIDGNGNGGSSVSVDSGSATVNGNSISMQGNGFNLTIRTQAAPVVNGGNIEGDIENIVLDTTPVKADLQGAGNVSASVSLDLTGLPAGAAITTTVSQDVDGDSRSAFQLAASGEGLKVNAVAYTMNIVKTNLANGADIKDATISMAVSHAWVKAHGGSDAMKIIRFAEDGTKEVLDTVYVGSQGDMDLFEAYSPNGLSIFGLAATGTSSKSPTSSGSVSGGKSTVSTESVMNIAAGETVSLVFDESAVTKIDVKAAEEIPELMLTVEEVSKPYGAEAAPAEVYQYVEVVSYHAPEVSVAMATLYFDVAKDWLDSISSSPSDVSVYRYDEDSEEWILISTVSDGSDVYAYNFFADTGEFGVFAITAKEGAVSADDASNPVTGISSESGASQSSESKSTTETGQGIPMSYLILATGLIIGIPAAGYGWLRMKKNN